MHNWGELQGFFIFRVKKTKRAFTYIWLTF